jgi:hypothetical protein
MASKNAERLATAETVNEPLKTDRLRGAICSSSSKSRVANQSFVSRINTGHTNQVRVHLYRWRDQTKIEIKPYSATVPGVFMPCGPGVALNISKIDELIEAITAAKIEAIARGLLEERAS